MIKPALDHNRYKTRDRVGGTLITDLFWFADRTYVGYSYYLQDKEQECVSEASGKDPIKTLKQSRKNLRKDWVEWIEWKKENPNYKESSY